MSSRRHSSRLSPAELEVLEVLWEREEATIRQMRAALPRDRRPAYTTVQTLVRRLEEKEAVERIDKIGNAHLYRPLVDPRSIHRRLVDELVDLLGSPKPIVAHLLESGRLSLADLRELEHDLDEPEDDDS